jgi:hypothetical protein
MKHIREYKVFEKVDIDDIKKTCEEILLELNDIGYETAVEILESKHGEPSTVIIYIAKYKKYMGFEEPLSIGVINDIKEYISRIEDYLNQFGLGSPHNIMKLPLITPIKCGTDHIYKIEFNKGLIKNIKRGILSNFS